ncbi:HIRAN domain-containing protein [bacterium]|nr:HIRAN domain-containing protein [bacterium]
MQAFRFYEVSVTGIAGDIRGQFAEASGSLQPVAHAGDAPLIDEWIVNDDVSGAAIRLAIRGEAGARRLAPIGIDPAHRLTRLYGALAYFRAGMIARGLEKVHSFRYADNLDMEIAAGVLSADERMNAFAEAFLGPWSPIDVAFLSPLRAIAGIDAHADPDDIRRVLRDWYARAEAWSTRVAGFSYHGGAFIREECGVEKTILAKGDECRLFREPYNPVDPNAIGIMHVSGRKLGYVRKTIAALVAPLMDLGVVYRAKVGAFLSNEFDPPERVYVSVERVG